ncbi:chromate efflux transporter [Planctomicrobium piriforme]|uniref:chromate efflux transporter n=1 Tax=Planctomicrobium piriforme TaxID=1576369 RepID=UPI001C31C291|nr:chromate efflux transporter [Planctomicrobium piriforme]
MNDTETVPAAPSPVSLREAFWTWCRVALLSFGGPAGQIAVMHRILVDEKKWIGEARFLHALNFCMLLPGPEAQQLATYIGWLMHGVRGGLMAGTLFILPGAVSILLLSVMYAEWQDATFVQAFFFGLKPAVLAIVIEAVLRIGKRVLKNRVMLAIAVCSFVGIFFFKVPFPVIIAAAGLTGLIGGKLAPQWFQVLKGHGSSQPTASEIDLVSTLPEQKATLRHSLLVSVVCLTLWFGPILLLAALLGRESVFYQEAVFFSQAAVVTFGGAYSVLAYLAQQAVERFHWLQSGEMLDGLGMAETTPGPLIMVVQFVGFMGAYRHPGPFSPLMAGVLGSIVTTWVTFVPCFYWIFLGAPYIERLRQNRLLSAALSSITAAVVGVVLNLAVWFAMHTLFRRVVKQTLGPLTLDVPDWAASDPPAALIAFFACWLTFRTNVGMVWTLAICCAMGMAFRMMM